jgi:hypothetical protein
MALESTIIVAPKKIGLHCPPDNKVDILWIAQR